MNAYLAVLMVAMSPSSVSTLWNSSTASLLDARNKAWPVSLYGSKLMLARVGSGLNKAAKALASSGVSFIPSIRTTSTNKCSLRLDCKTSAKASLYEHEH